MVNKSLHKIEKELKGQGHDISYRTIGRIFKNGILLQANKKAFEGSSHPKG